MCIYIDQSVYYVQEKYDERSTDRFAIAATDGAQPRSGLADNPCVKKKRRAPWKVGLIAFLLAMLVGAVATAIIMSMRHDARSPFERGQAAGNALAGACIAVGVIAYLIAAKRAKQDQPDERDPSA